MMTCAMPEILVEPAIVTLLVHGAGRCGVRTNAHAVQWSLYAARAQQGAGIRECQGNSIREQGSGEHRSYRLLLSSLSVLSSGL